MDTELGAVLILGIYAPKGQTPRFVVVRSLHKRAVHKTLYYKFPAGRIEETDIPLHMSQASLSVADRIVVAEHGAYREFTEETSISRSALARMNYVRTLPRKGHVLYVFVAVIREDAVLPASGTIGVTGDEVSYRTQEEMLSSDFMPVHRLILQDLIR